MGRGVWGGWRFDVGDCGSDLEKKLIKRWVIWGRVFYLSNVKCRWCLRTGGKMGAELE